MSAPFTFGPEENVRRADRGRRHLEAYATETGLDLHPDADGPTLALGDLLSDLLHAYGPSVVEDALEAGQWHFDAEAVAS